MSHLRLVAGTAVRTADIEQSNVRSEEAAPVQISVNDTEQHALEEKARQAIYAYRFPSLGKTVTEIFLELNVLLRDESIDTIAAITRSSELKTALFCIGLRVFSALPEHNLTVDLYGLVTDEKRLIKLLPELKKCLPVLPGLTL